MIRSGLTIDANRLVLLFEKFDAATELRRLEEMGDLEEAIRVASGILSELRSRVMDRRGQRGFKR